MMVTVLIFGIRFHKYFEQLLHFAIIINIIQLTFLPGPNNVHFPKQLIHILGAELKILLHPLHPLLVHLIIIFMHELFDPILKHGNLVSIVEVEFHNVADHEEGELYFFVIGV